MKTLKILALVLVFCVLGTSSAFAAPATIDAGSVGNVSDLIVITNPPVSKAATFDQSYIISGYGKEGVTVTLYWLDNGTYKKSDYSWKIGASGIFFKRVELGKGKNDILCYAESNGSRQHVKLEITYLSTGFNDMMSGIKVDSSTIFNR